MEREDRGRDGGEGEDRRRNGRKVMNRSRKSVF